MIRTNARRLAAGAIALLTLTAAPTAFADDIDDAVRARFAETMAEACDEPAAAIPTIYDISEPPAYAGGPDRVMRLYEFICYAAAYTVVDMYFAYSPVAGVGIQPVFFAVPDFATDCTTPVAALDCKAVRFTMNGMTTVGELANTRFDAATLTLTSRICWRGPCDAFAEGVWLFRDGRFVLKTYDVDATYDGDQTPQRIVDFVGAP